MNRRGFLRLLGGATVGAALRSVLPVWKKPPLLTVPLAFIAPREFSKLAEVTATEFPVLMRADLTHPAQKNRFQPMKLKYRDQFIDFGGAYLAPTKAGGTALAEDASQIEYYSRMGYVIDPDAAAWARRVRLNLPS